MTGLSLGRLRLSMETYVPLLPTTMTFRVLTAPLAVLLLVAGQCPWEPSPEAPHQAPRETDPFARDVAALMGVPAADVAEDAEAFLACIPSDIVEIVRETAAFAAGEPFESTQALLTDFTRQLVVQASGQLPCQGLSSRWDAADPFLRMTADPGVGLTEADIEAGEALERLAGGDPSAVRSRVLALWDGYDPEEEAFSRLFLARLNAWTPAVAYVWGDLDETARHDATRATHSDTIPELPVIEGIIGTDAVIEWIGGGVFNTATEGFERYEDVLALAKAGYFGGRPYVEVVARYQALIDGMNSIMYSQQALGTIFDLMDMNAETLQSSY